MKKALIAQILRASLESNQPALEADDAVATPEAADDVAAPAADAVPADVAPIAEEAAPAADAAVDAAPEASTDAVVAEEVAPVEEAPVADAPVADAVVDAVAEEAPVEDAPAADAVVATEDAEERAEGEPVEEAPVEDAAADTVADAPVLDAAPVAEVSEDAAEAVAEAAADAPVEEAPIAEAVVAEDAAAAPIEEAPVAAAEDIAVSVDVVPAEDAAPVEAAAEEVAPAAAEGGDEDFTGAIEVPAYDADDAVEYHADERDIEDTADAVVEMSEVANGLEAIAVALEASLPNGGLQPQAAAMLNIAVESYTSRVGYAQPVALGIESFGGQSTRIQATTVSLENVKEVITKIWEAIKAAMKRVYEAVVAFAKRVLSSTAPLKARAEALAEKAKGVSGKANSESVDIGASSCSRIAVNGLVTHPVTDFHGLTMVIEQLEDFDDEGIAAQTIMNGVIMDALKAENDDHIEVAFADLRKIDMHVAKMFSEKTHSDNGTEFSTKELPGGRVYTLVFSDSNDEDPIVRIKTMMGSFNFRSEDNRKAVPEDFKAKTLSVAEIEEISKLTLHLCGKIDVLQESLKQIEDGVKGMESMHEGLNPAISDANARRFADLLRASGKFVTTFMRVPTSMYGYGASLAPVYLKLAEASLAQYAAK